MAQFIIYRSTDASAPVLTGAVGSLVALLDACLVNGYGAKAAAGWTKPFTGTNKAAFRQGAGSNQFYYRVQDDAGGTGGAKEALIRGAESMSDVDTPTNPFPTAAQIVLTSNSLVARKSVTADATARPWIVAADSRTCYVFMLSGDVSNAYQAFMLGEFYSTLAGDGYRAMIVGRTTENAGSAGSEAMQNQNAIMAVTAGHFAARSYTGVAGAITLNKHGDPGKGGSSTTLLGSIPYPNPEDNSLYLAPISISEVATVTLRGRMRGWWQWLHVNTAVSDGDTFNGTGDLAGKTFMIIKGAVSPTINYIIETSNTLETN